MDLPHMLMQPPERPDIAELRELLAMYLKHECQLNEWIRDQLELANNELIDKVKQRKLRNFTDALEEKTKDHAQHKAVLRLIHRAKQLKTNKLLFDRMKTHQIEQWLGEEAINFMRAHKIDNEIIQLDCQISVNGTPKTPEEELQRNQIEFTISQRLNDQLLLDEKIKHHDQKMRELDHQHDVEKEMYNKMKEELRLDLLEHYKQCIKDLQQPKQQR